MEHTLSLRSVAVVGVGRMGGSMALNLQRAGFVVHAYDSSPEQVAAVARQGIIPADTLQAAARDADAIVLMLPSDDVLQRVMEGQDGLIDQLRPGHVLLDMGTSKLATSQRLAGLVAARGATMLDAPVSGGEQGARDGTLSIMVGGDHAAFERCRPLLTAMGKTLTYVGGNGMGLIAKFVNQMLMEASFCVIAEAFTLAAKAGADLDAVYNAVRDGLGGSRVLDGMIPQLLSGDFGNGRELTLHHKDGAYALAAAEALGVWSPVTDLTHDLLDQALAAGQGIHSAVAVSRVYEQRAGIQVQKLSDGSGDIENKERIQKENREPRTKNT